MSKGGDRFRARHFRKSGIVFLFAGQWHWLQRRVIFGGDFGRPDVRRKWAGARRSRRPVVQGRTGRFRWLGDLRRSGRAARKFLRVLDWWYKPGGKVQPSITTFSFLFLRVCIWKYMQKVVIEFQTSRKAGFWCQPFLTRRSKKSAFNFYQLIKIVITT